MPPRSLRDEITSLLNQEPLPASELYDQLEKSGLQRQSIKAAVGRLVGQGIIHRGPLRLGRGNTILYSGSPTPTPKLLKKLVENGFYGRESLISLIRCLRSSHPAVTKYDVAKIAALEIGRPEEPDWEETERTIAGLVSIGVLAPSSSNFFHNIWVGDKSFLRSAGLSFSKTNVNPSFLMIRERVRETVTSAIADWLQKNSIIGFGSAQVGNLTTPTVNYLGLPFDVLGFTYLSGVVDRTGTAVGRAVVGDVLVDQCNEAYAQSFTNRVRQAASKTKVWPLQFILAKGFDHDALTYLKSEGVLVWHQGQLLGEKTAEAIQQTLSIVETLVKKQEVDPNLFSLVFDGLENFESLFGNLKGKLFEILIGYLFQKRGYETRLSWQIEEDDQSYDVDIVGILGAEAAIVECKGLREGGVVSEDQVKRHFTKRTRVARDILLRDPLRRPNAFKSIVATSGAFDPTAVDALDRGLYGSKSDTVLELWDRTRLLHELRVIGHADLAQVVERYF